MSEQLFHHFNICENSLVLSSLGSCHFGHPTVHMTHCHKIGNTPTCPKHSKAQYTDTHILAPY